jgi:hypothetical protein
MLNESERYRVTTYGLIVVSNYPSCAAILFIYVRSRSGLVARRETLHLSEVT